MSMLQEFEGLSGALNVSPLHGFWSTRSQLNDWVEIGGYTLPGILSDWNAETAVLSGAAGFADISWRQVVRFTGAEIEAGLDKMFERPPGAARSGWYDVTWQDSRGYLRGAGRMAALGQREVILCSAASDLGWFACGTSNYDLSVSRVRLLGLRLAGPACLQALDGLTTGSSQIQRSFPGISPVWLDVRDQGFADVWSVPDQALAIAQLLARNGMRPVGARALEAWRIQAGLARPGVDWAPVQDVLDLSLARQAGELTGPHGSFYLAEVPAAASGHRFTSVATWPPSGQTLGIGWSRLGHYQEPKDGSGGRFLKVATTD